MKKLALMLVILLTLPLTAFCGEAPVWGEWTAVSASVAGESYSADELGIDLMLLLREDGTASVVSRDDEYGDTLDEGVWTISENIVTLTESDLSMVLLLRDGKMTLVYDSAAMVFERTGDNTDVPEDLNTEPYAEETAGEAGEE